MSSKKLASLIIKISANSAQAQKELKTLEAKVSDFGKSMQRLGSSLTKYVTVPLTAMAGLSVRAANTQLQAEARLLTALKNRQDVQQRLIDQASEIQSRTTYGDEAIIEQQAYLAALGLTEEQIRETIEASVQLSAAMGIELESAVHNLAKTYSGLAGELGESMPALREMTAEQLKSGEAIRFVNREYKGFAEAVADTGAGSLQQLKNKIGDLAEKLGTALLPMLNKIVDVLGKFADWLSTLPDGVQTLVVSFGTLAAVAGPVLSFLSQLGPMLAGLASGMATAAAAGMALGYALYQWLNADDVERAKQQDELLAWSDKVQQKLNDIKAKTAVNYGGLAAQMSNNELTSLSKSLADDLKPLNDELKELSQGAGAFGQEFVNFWTWLEGPNGQKLFELRGALSAVNNEIERRNTLIKNGYGDGFEKQIVDLSVFEEKWKKLNSELTSVEDSLARATNEKEEWYLERRVWELRKEMAALVETLPEEFRKAYEFGLIPQLESTLDKLRESLMLQDTEEGIARVNSKIKELEATIQRLKSLTTDVSTPIEQAARIALSGDPFSDIEMPGVKPGGIVDSTTRDLQKWWDDLSAETDRIAELSNAIASALSTAFANVATAIGEGIASFITGEDFNPLQKVLGILGDLLTELGTAMIAYSAALEAFKLAIKSMNPWAALGAGVGLIAAGAVIKSIANKPIKLATGGLAYGPTMAVVGDNPGAANDPEVIAPLSKLRDYMGGQKLQLMGDVAFEIHGDTLQAVLNRNNLRLATLG